MIVPFDNISDQSRLWVYQADRQLLAQDIAYLSKSLKNFLTQWAAHGAPLEAAYKIAYDQFVIIAVDEGVNQASGCSIDASVHTMQEISKTLGIDFFDRTKIAFLVNDKIHLASLTNIKAKVEEEIIREDTLTFNNLIDSKKSLETSWVVPARDTWLSRYFKKSVHNI